ncbi:MAG: MgtC/SapB family protein [Betaproteobacteria bacterium]
MDATLELLLGFATSAGIGLLVGLERERNPQAKAGLRTFALIALLGSLAVVLARELDSPWIVAVGLLLVGATVAGAYFIDPATKADASGTTTVIAALLVYGLGALNAAGYRVPAVALGVALTALLYFKAELEGFSRRLTAQDIRSILQFALLTAVILPLLPDAPLTASGPLAVLNPRHLWLMVVLIAGVSLAGYVAWRLTLDRHGLALTGLLGGLVSSTATTLVYARHAKSGAQPPAAALLVILLANATMFLRVLLVVGIVAPGLLPYAAPVLLPALLLAAPPILARWKAARGVPDTGDGYRNPTNLGTALAFGAGYALVLVIAAWVAERVGTAGVSGLAAASGLTDVDAITLSLLRLFSTGELIAPVAATAIALAVGSNLLLKTALVFAVGGRKAGVATALAFAAPLAGLAAAIGVLHALA